MTRAILILSLMVLPACVVREIDAIIAKYDTFGEVSSAGDGDTSTSSGSTSGTDAFDTTSTTMSIETASTGGAEGGMDASSGADSSSGTTGPVESFCGDGMVDGDETCDDMNDDPDDGCKLCTKDRLVFASSAKYQGFALQGLFGADQRCRMLAALAMLPNFGTYRAWLSDGNTAAADRISHSQGRYTLVNGLVVAEDWDGLVSGMLVHSINTTESSELSNGTCTWTGTLANGQPAFGSSFCNNWGEGEAFQEGGGGLGDQLGEWWSFFNMAGCESDCAIYCFESPDLP